MNFNLRSISQSSTSKDSFILFTGAAISVLFGLLLTILLTRNIDPTGFGLLITALVFTQLVVDLFELGINPAVLNFITSSAKEDIKFKYLKIAFLMKISIALIVSVLVFTLAPLIAELVFHNTSIIPFIRISALGIFLLMILGCAQTIFQAEKRFFLSAFTGSLTNILRVLAILTIVLLGFSTAINAYLAVSGVLIVAVALALINIKVKFLKSNNNFVDYKKLAGFGLPIGLGFSLAAVYTRLDQILVFNLVGEQEAGIYGLASRLILPLILVSTAFNSAIIPRFVSLEEKNFSNYFHKTLFVSLSIAGLPFLAIFLAPLVVPIIFGNKFYDSILPFQVLALGATLFVINSPFMSAIIYRFKKSRFPFMVSLLSLVLVLIFLNVLVPQYKSLGAAISITLIYALQLIFSFLYFIYLKNKTFSFLSFNNFKEAK